MQIKKIISLCLIPVITIPMTGCAHFLSSVNPFHFGDFSAPEVQPAESRINNFSAANIDIWELLNRTITNPYNVNLNADIKSQSDVQSGTSYSASLTMQFDGTTEHTFGTETDSGSGRMTGLDRYAVDNGTGIWTGYSLNNTNEEWETNENISPYLRTILDPTGFANMQSDEMSVPDKILYTGEYSGSAGNTSVMIKVSMETGKIDEISLYTDDGSINMTFQFNDPTGISVIVPQEAITPVLPPEPEPVSENDPPEEPEPEPVVQNGEYITIANVNYRSGPSLDADIITLIPKGTLVSGIPYDDEWSEITYEGQKGYMNTFYLGNPENVSMYSVTDNLNLRSAPNTDSKILDVIKKMTSIRGVADENGWVKVNYNFQTGYVNINYLEKTNEDIYIDDKRSNITIEDPPDVEPNPDDEFTDNLNDTVNQDIEDQEIPTDESSL